MRFALYIVSFIAIAGAGGWFTAGTSSITGNATAHVDAAAQEKRSQRRAHRSGRVVLEADGRGHYVAQFRMNGRKITALVDTGASHVSLSEKLARRIGIRVSRSDFTSRTKTANGIVKVAPVTIDRIKIGKIEIRDVAGSVHEGNGFGDFALLGMSFLGRLESFTIEDGLLILER